MLDQLDTAARLRRCRRTWSSRSSTNIWRQVQHDIEQPRQDPSRRRARPRKRRASEYRKIAERRVRLGLVLAEDRRDRRSQVTEEELRRRSDEQARRYPGQEKQVFDYYREEPGRAGRAARADLRGEGRRLHPRIRPSRDRQEGVEGGAPEAEEDDDHRASPPP